MPSEYRRRRSNHGSSSRSSRSSHAAHEPEPPTSPPPPPPQQNPRAASPARSATSSASGSSRRRSNVTGTSSGGAWVRRTTPRDSTTGGASSSGGGEATHELSHRNLRDHRTSTLWHSSSRVLKQDPGAAQRVILGLLPLLAASIVPGLAIARLPRKMQALAAGAYAVPSALSFALYRNAAVTPAATPQQASWLDSETWLHAANLLGGWPGALLGAAFFSSSQPQTHTRTRKKRFQQLLWVSVLLHQLLWLDLASNGRVGAAGLRVQRWVETLRKKYLPNLKIRWPKLNVNLNPKAWLESIRRWRLPTFKETLEKIPTPAKSAAKKAARERTEAQQSRFESLLPW